MEKLRTPVMIDAIYVFLVGVSTITPGLAMAIWGGPEIRDLGLLLAFSGVCIGFGVVLWGVASNIEKYGGLASHLVAALIIVAVFMAWAWFGGTFGARTALPAIVINIVLAVWIWSAKPK